MKIGEGSGRKIEKDRKTILREERLKEKLVEVQKIGAENSSNSMEKKEKLLREDRIEAEKR